MKKQLQLLLVSFICCLLQSCSDIPQPQAGIGSSYAVAQNHFSAQQDLIGQPYKITVENNEDVTQIAERYSLGYRELSEANPNRNLNYLYAGSTLIIPKEYVLPPAIYRKGIVINIASLRLFYFDKHGNVATYPVALGREGWHTPLGQTIVYRKEERPIWNVPKSIRADYLAKTGKEHPEQVFPGPENPLGNYAIYLGWNGYLIHGTNAPASIGRLVSSGCIRMYNNNVAELYYEVKRGTPVTIVYYPVEAGWRGNELYLEAHRPVSFEQQAYQNQIQPVSKVIEVAVGNQHVQIDWDKVNQVVRARTGIPTVVGHRLA